MGAPSPRGTRSDVVAFRFHQDSGLQVTTDVLLWPHNLTNGGVRQPFRVVSAGIRRVSKHPDLRVCYQLESRTINHHVLCDEVLDSRDCFWWEKER